MRIKKRKVKPRDKVNSIVITMHGSKWISMSFHKIGKGLISGLCS